MLFSFSLGGYFQSDCNNEVVQRGYDLLVQAIKLAEVLRREVPICRIGVEKASG